MELIPQTSKLINRPLNWDIFRKNLNKNLSMNRSHKNNKEIDTNIQHLTELIKNAIKSALSPENTKKKFNFYKTYLSTVNPNDASLWNAINKILKQKDTIPPLKVGLAKYETNIDKCKIFAQHLENCFSTETTTTNITQQIDFTKTYSMETNTIIYNIYHGNVVLLNGGVGEVSMEYESYQ
ncbi:hypothetical protein QTP88_022272 [Uroleucon formosanum]